jgi:predicted ArsR family transcriptional regulator
MFGGKPMTAVPAQADPVVSQRMELALAVMQPGAPVRLVNSDNTGGAIVSLWGAVASGGAYMVNLRDGIIVFDCDPGELSATDAAAGRHALEQIGCPVVRVSSGRPGSEHWWFVAPVGWTTGLMRQMAITAGVPAGQIRWGERDCRPPLSPHRLGYPVALIEPPNVEAALVRFRRPGQTTFDDYKWSMVLNSGIGPNGEYRNNRTAAAMGLALAYVNAGREFSQFRDALWASAALSPKLQSMKPAAASSWLQTTWDNACRRVREHPPESQIDGHLDALNQTLARYSWQRAQGDTDRTVFGFLVGLAHQLRATVVSRSMRSLEETLGLSRHTIRASIQSLIAAELVVVEKPHGFAQARSYRLVAKVDVSSPKTYHCPPAKGAIGEEDSKFEPHDLFRGKRGLPSRTRATLNACSNSAFCTVGEVAAARGGGLQVATIREHLRALLAYGLVERNSAAGHRWRRTAAADDSAVLDSLAAFIGARGHRAATRERNRREQDEADKQFIAVTGMSRADFDLAR